MCRTATLAAVCVFAGATVALAQPASGPLTADWRRVGGQGISHPLGDAATGAIDRVWYVNGGLAVQTRSGKTFFSNDFESWTPAPLSPPAPRREQAGIAYRAQGDVFRSEDGGRVWINLTGFRGMSILRSAALDVAVSPSDPLDLAVANGDGVWRSLDGGVTWAGLNDRLPNLEVRRILEVPGIGNRSLRIATPESILAWEPGGLAIWQVAGVWTEPPAVLETRGGYTYQGARNGRISVSRDGVPRPEFFAGNTPIERIWVDPADPAFAVALAGSSIFRTANGGVFWDEISANLGSWKAGTLRGVTGDRQNRALYVAAEGGVFYTPIDFSLVGSVTEWRRVEGPWGSEAAWDVRLDSAANQLYAAIDGQGVFATLAPHRRRSPVLLSAADLVARPAAPGALMALAGAAVTSAKSNGLPVPILAATETETHLQIPFDSQGGSLNLQFENAQARWGLAVSLEEAAPAIFGDRDGAPMVLDADSGLLINAMNPLRSGARLQILATGLGRVQPEFPSGVEAPALNPPEVVANVRVLFDGQPLPVTRKTLAPGYIGFYLVESQLPATVNSGTAELFLEAAGRASNRVRVYIEP